MKKFYFRQLLLLVLIFAGRTVNAQYHLNLDGVNDYVRVTYYPALQSATAVTVEAWINATAWKTPIYKGSVICTGNNVGQNNGFDLRAAENGTAEFNLSIAGNWVTATSAPIMQTGTWYHVAGVYSGDSVMIYINGVLRGLTIVSGGMIPSTGNLNIGESPGWTGRSFSGRIDEVRFWNYGRTQSEITSTICSSLTGTEPGLAGYWKLDATNGTITAVNSVAGGNNGTLINASIGSVWVSGDYNCTLSSPDIGAGALVAPVSNFNLTNAEQVSVSITNYSTNPISGFPVSYQIGNNTPVTETVSNPVPPFGTYTFTFTQTADLSTYQNYSFKTYTGLAGDVSATNDTLVKTVSNFAVGTNFGINFDGLDDKITIADAAALNPTTAITVEAWINATTWRNSIADGSIIAKDIDAPNRGYVLRCGKNGSIEFMISDNGSWKSAASPSVMLTNRWYHIAGVFDGSYVILYINGEMIARTPAAALSVSPTDLLIGESPTWSGRTFNGRMDEIRIWNIARSQNDIQSNMATSFAGTEPGLAAYYKLDEGLGNSTVNDATSGANNGTLNNFVLANAWVSGYEQLLNDITVLGLESPNNLNAFSGASRVKVKVKNTGFNAVSGIPVSYSINNGASYTDTILSTLQVNEIYTLNFNKVEDLSALTSANIAVRSTFTNDTDIRNDSAVATLTKPTAGNILVAFNGVQHDFAGNGQTHFRDVLFPEGPENWSQIIMHVSVACPVTGCDPWDQAGKISLFKEGREYELGRFVTPYGKACGPWDIDVTDFKTLLTGKQKLQSFIQVWGPSGWMLTVTFEFIAAPTANPFQKITPLWNTDYHIYGDPNIPYTLPNITILVDAKSNTVSTRMTLSGHGQGNTLNAAEFSQMTHQLNVNGSNAFSHLLWKSNCGSNTCANQSGTWTLSRAGWCPGQGVTPIVNNLTGNVTPGSTATIGYTLQQYTNLLNTGYNGSSHTEPYYRLHAYLIESSDSAQGFSDFTNATATRITSPVGAPTLSANEIVKAIVKNNGSIPMTNPRFSYFLNGIRLQTDTLFITLQPGDSIEHTFSQTADMSVQNDYTLHALVTAGDDANASDDVATKTIFQISSVNENVSAIGLNIMPNPNNGKFTIQVAGVSGKMNIEVYDVQGKIVFKKEDMANGKNYQTDIDLGNITHQLYFIRVISEKGTGVAKIGIQ
ncbi:MAG: T9SS type A sorting domain-containing protein [Bacteroidetes bacterium]|nr:T9SS type A sorting domain-containing protein [Bacteroidota bacterium]